MMEVKETYYSIDFILEQRKYSSTIERPSPFSNPGKLSESITQLKDAEDAYLALRRRGIEPRVRKIELMQDLTTRESEVDMTHLLGGR